MKVWIDGAIVEASEARIPVLDHGLLYGDGIFEGIRAYARGVFRLDDHLARLVTSAKAIGLAAASVRLSPAKTQRVARRLVAAAARIRATLEGSGT